MMFCIKLVVVRIEISREQIVVVVIFKRQNIQQMVVNWMWGMRKNDKGYDILVFFLVVGQMMDCLLRYRILEDEYVFGIENYN